MLSTIAWDVARGIPVTLMYSLISLFFGMILGALLAYLRTFGSKISVACVKGYVSVMRGTPLMVQLMIMYYALPQIINAYSSSGAAFKVSPVAAGLFAFSLNSAAYVSELIRSGINGVDPGQTEAIKSLAIPSHLAMRDIILPQALRVILPALVSESINLVKESAIISIIGVADIMRHAQASAGKHFTYLEPMLIAALYYYLIVHVLSMIGSWLERRMSND
jgi:His/Glu/Gln/Arg/opine family amino acid ABC transporter permease subunit